MQDVCGQHGAAPASCAGLQSRQFPAHAGDARADQELVADELEGEADQDRRQGGEPWPLCRLSDGRGRHPSANVPGDFTAHCGTTAAATTSASMRPSMGSKSNRREQYVQMPAKIARSAGRPPFGLPEMLVAVHTSRLSCREAEKAPIFTPVQESSGESKLILLKTFTCSGFGADSGWLHSSTVAGTLAKRCKAGSHL